MNRSDRTAIVVCLLPALLALAAPPSPAEAGADPFGWLDDLDQARRLARTQEKPLLIVFRCEP